MTFLENQIEVSHIPNGLYYVRSIIQTDAVSYPAEFLFEMTDQTVEPLVIVAKKTDTMTTKVKLIKVDQDHNRLEGVGFKLVSVARDVSEKEVPLIGEYRYSSSGQVGRTLYTDKNGEIFVTNLPLWELSFQGGGATGRLCCYDAGYGCPAGRSSAGDDYGCQSEITTWQC
ncbi:SpaA isopeptide-forming pilin-related protein [Streptococcus pneumoniae]|uniref:SpaA isopeptide-forming pilin-related protein n=2 Tax=Streptococcus pneumoniae TaxID=1313 RepID=UPI001D171F90|nr:hypothetical protein [Streptococcus pneumoniae]